ncbi:membrane integrity-associated transporter subunit PqiC [Paraburkholderia sp. DHOC27]|uniref:PqiC family protein n=1 Tax=Paraburkholderia sp. DHOC27 TaxID=2303330 RepID=UPI000E3DD2C7|nr:PqiC family protein [Paraburkholderia sp. DHOC27]RFU45854.1 membrane integrity-associated transporter subunit PqiC [Paraburkholderia sp. DHOC27]
MMFARPTRPSRSPSALLPVCASARASASSPAPHGLRRAAACLAVGAGLLALAACSSPASHFYTLGNADAPVTAHSMAAPNLLIEVPPVDVPSQVAKNQLVVQTGPTQVQILEQERWASLPGDEIRRALSTDLTQQLGTIDVYGTAYPEGTPVYRVSVNVQRFESWPGSHALIDAVWSVRAVGNQTVMTCRSVVNQPVTGSYDALVDGHRQAVQQISAQIVAGIKEMAAAPQVHTAAPPKKASGVSARVAPASLPCPASAEPNAAASGASVRVSNNNG